MSPEAFNGMMRQYAPAFGIVALLLHVWLVYAGCQAPRASPWRCAYVGRVPSMQRTVPEGESDRREYAPAFGNVAPPLARLARVC